MDYKYYEYLGSIVIDMELRAMNVGAYRSLFDHIYYVSLWRKRLIESQTHEQTAMARWSVGDARDNLEHIMQVLEFSDPLKEKIRYVADSPLSCVRI